MRSWAFKLSTKDLRSVFGNMSQEMKESRCPFPPEPLLAIKMEPGQTHGTYSSNGSMLPPPPQYSVQSRQQDDDSLPTPPRLSAAHIHDSAEKQHQVDNSSKQHVLIRRVSLPIMATATTSTPGNCMATPHSVTPPSMHANHSSSSTTTTDETLGAPPIEDDPITLGLGGSSRHHDGSNHHHNHHHHNRVSLPETM
jgi:hypothetical protein